MATQGYFKSLTLGRIELQLIYIKKKKTVKNCCLNTTMAKKAAKLIKQI